MRKVQLITDGGCIGNPGPGGWAAILRHDGDKKEIYGCEPWRTPCVKYVANCFIFPVESLSPRSINMA